MAKFQFRMESVLQFRRAAMEREEAIRNEILREREYWNWQCRQLDEARSDSRQNLPLVARDGLMVLQQQDIFLRRASRQHRQILEKQRECEGRLQLQLKRVAEAHQKVRLLEKLRESAFAEWRRDQDRQIEELAADMYLAKLNRENRVQ